ncbi:alpha/beta-hydrolase [Gonapodya prolifera JEL478]|uniref:sn-1-specific diacylglycerol lipase n=1 Tax=Gonapodya prolifera (strain JEL478) TaxID=1344416 RepID=A0A139AGD8_GONPJ|nr:alpha/beta-hydrolase [Gonapodya prolifera JEL478]|eukprot:KXS15505.1 alpha/beta-hydrolase [Gonapodya prolifera JEL478]
MFDSVQISVVERTPRNLFRRTISSFALPLRTLANIGPSGHRTIDLPKTSLQLSFAGHYYNVPSFSVEGSHTSSLGSLDLRVEFEHVDESFGPVRRTLNGLLNHWEARDDRVTPQVAEGNSALEVAPIKTLASHWLTGPRSLAVPTLVSLGKFLGSQLRRTPSLLAKIVPASFVRFFAQRSPASQADEDSTSLALKQRVMGEAVVGFDHIRRRKLWKGFLDMHAAISQGAPHIEHPMSTPKFSAYVLKQFQDGKSSLYSDLGRRSSLISGPSRFPNLSQVTKVLLKSTPLSDRVRRRSAIFTLLRETAVSVFTSSAFARGYRDFDSLFVSWTGVPISGPRWLRAWSVLKSVDSGKMTPSWPTRSERVESLTDPTVLETAVRFLDYSYATYGTSIEGWQGSLRQLLTNSGDRGAAERHLGLHGGLSRGTVLYWHGREEVFEPVWFAAYDKEQQALVISIRGTWNVHGLLTDVVAQYVPFPESGLENGIAHKGFLTSARTILGKHLKHIEDWVEEWQPAKIVLTGHSYGASVATVLGILLREYLPELRRLSNDKLQLGIEVWGFGSAPSVSPSVAQHFTAPSIENDVETPFKIRNFISFMDEIPRFSYGSLLDLRERIIAVDDMLSVKRRTRVPIGEIERRLEALISNDDRWSWPGGGHPKLWLAGDVVHLTPYNLPHDFSSILLDPTEDKSSTALSVASSDSTQVRWIPRTITPEVLMQIRARPSGSWLKAHTLDNYALALKSSLATLTYQQLQGKGTR